MIWLHNKIGGNKPLTTTIWSPYIIKEGNSYDGNERASIT
jgi:hypothetical protein